MAAHVANVATARFYFALMLVLARHLIVAYEMCLPLLPHACFRSRSARDRLALLLLTRAPAACADRWKVVC